MILIRNTYACNPVIAALDEYNLGVIMAERVKAEQTRHGLKPGAIPPTPYRDEVDFLIMRVITKEPQRTKEIADAIRIGFYATQNHLTKLSTEGTIKRVLSTGIKRDMKLWSLP